MNTLGDVKARVRALVGDPMGDFCTDAYLTPLINQVYEDQATELMADTGSSFDEVVVEVLAVDVGTTSLGPFQAATMPLNGGGTAPGPLFGLVTPLWLKVKQAGQPEGNYAEADRATSLPDVSLTDGTTSTTNAVGGLLWEWRGSILYLTPLAYVADLRIKGEFNFPALVRDTDVLTLHPRIGTATAYATAALVGQERENASYAAGYAEQASRMLVNIDNLLVRSEQGTVTRIGRGSGSRNH